MFLFLFLIKLIFARNFSGSVSASVVRSPPLLLGIWHVLCLNLSIQNGSYSNITVRTCLESPWIWKLKFKALTDLEYCSRCWRVLEICCQFYSTKLLKCLRRNSVHSLPWASDVASYWLDFALFAVLEKMKKKMCPWKAFSENWSKKVHEPRNILLFFVQISLCSLFQGKIFVWISLLRSQKKKEYQMGTNKV